MGGDTTTTTSAPSDPNATMMQMVMMNQAANAANQSSAMSQDMWNTAKPYLLSQFQFSDDVMTPYYTQLYGNAQSLLNAQTDLGAEQIDQAFLDIQRSKPVKDALTQEQLNEISWSSPVRAAFYDAALKGVDPETWRGQAAADVNQAYTGAEGSIRRELGRQGLDPMSGAYAGALANMEYKKAADTAFARGNATRAAETENFNRLTTGVNAAGRATGLAGTVDTSQKASNLTAVSGSNPYNTSGASDATGNAMSGMAGVGNLYGNLAGQFGKPGTTTTQSGGGSGILGSILGTGAGVLGSWGLSKLG